jgi:hypothetical protein
MSLSLALQRKSSEFCQSLFTFLAFQLNILTLALTNPLIQVIVEEVGSQCTCSSGFTVAVNPGCQIIILKCPINL